jgi:hypothetical protein
MATLKIVKTQSQLGRTVSASALSAWEMATGYHLPEDYRRFLLTYNGGVVRPWIFRHDHRDVKHEEDREALLDYLYDWQDVIGMSELSVPRSQSAQPPHHIVIGQDPGGAGVLLSLDPATYGRIYYWLRVLLTWGEPPNDTLGHVADSFTGFLNTLFDDGKTGHPYWKVVTQNQTPVPLVL